MSKLSLVLMVAAVGCFAAAVITRIGAPGFFFLFSLNQYLDLTTLFVLGAILTTLREGLSGSTRPS